MKTFFLFSPFFFLASLSVFGIFVENFSLLTPLSNGGILLHFDHEAPEAHKEQSISTVHFSTKPILQPSGSSSPYPWKKQIVTTVFWIGETPTPQNLISNTKSSWDERWVQNFGGIDSPHQRDNFTPLEFNPSQNPFYVALPFNDIGSDGKTKSIVSKVVPWFSQTFRKSGKSILKGRWIAIRKADRVCYAQWEDVGPFATDDWGYVFGKERPRSNRNRNAGLDVSPAVRDYLGLKGMDLTDWKFVEVWEVPPGPWRKWGSNNIFAMLPYLQK